MSNNVRCSPQHSSIDY